MINYSESDKLKQTVKISKIPKSMEEYFQANRKLWDAWTAINASSEFYDVAAFKQGKCSLFDIDLEEVGDVQGKKLLHLQCHFGMDTLSWARLGADVTGVDFSGDAITLALSRMRIGCSGSVYSM
jgi:2-polyprenyl-3-methyl-5-hydroxy-6-metoxy-1,4-benzoquinol methylase